MCMFDSPCAKPRVNQFESSSGFLVGFSLRRGWGRLGVVGVVVGVLASVLVVVPSGGVGAVGGVGAPSGLSAVSVEGGVLLSWDAPESGVSEVSGYRVFRRLSERGERSLSVLVSDTGSSETSFLDVSAAIGGELFVYRVAALFDGVVGKRSVRALVRYETPEAHLRLSRCCGLLSLSLSLMWWCCRVFWGWVFMWVRFLSCRVIRGGRGLVRCRWTGS